jgi:hypothetical protein
LAYRIPDDAHIEIFIEDNGIADATLKIGQLGTIMRLPRNSINKKTQIEFFTEFGSLKNISQK